MKVCHCSEQAGEQAYETTPCLIILDRRPKNTDGASEPGKNWTYQTRIGSPLLPKN
jgi:hypothetical protein